MGKLHIQAKNKGSDVWVDHLQLAKVKPDNQNTHVLIHLNTFSGQTRE